MRTPAGWLAKNDVHIWLVRSHHPMPCGMLKACEALLDDTEQSRLQQLPRHGSRSEYLMSRAFVRTLLAEYAGIPARDWRFSANQYGRPAIASPATLQNLRFNLSHTEGLMACAISLDREVGVDVERVNQAIDLEELASLVFSPQERTRLAQASSDRKRDVFFALWTLKEAYIKARGMGFSIAPDTVEFKMTGATPTIQLAHEGIDETPLWHFHSAMATENHWLAVGASQAEKDNINFDLRWTASVTSPSLYRLPSQGQLYRDT